MALRVTVGENAGPKYAAIAPFASIRFLATQSPITCLENATKR